MARTNLEWDIYWILISYLDAEDMSDDIAQDIMQLLKGKLLIYEE